MLTRRTLNLIVSLAPAPMFLLGTVYSYIYSVSNICGAGMNSTYEMTVMWLVMFFAHLTPWLAWYQTRDLRLERNKYITSPHVQHGQSNSSDISHPQSHKE